jgi:riboflavin biosynthesis pyrimidine reductase
MTERFNAYCRRREQAALAATIPGYVTREDAQPPDMTRIANDWSRALFDGEFYRSALPSTPGTPVTNLVFVQSRDGNTAAPDPSTLGGGETDLHLIYEGLSRVDADAVFAGASTARAKDIVFSIWHPQLVALRRARGRTRHPAQVVVTNGPNLRLDDGLMFAEPELRVFVIASTRAAGPIRNRVDSKPWIDVIDAGEPLSFERALRDLRQRGVEVLSCVGGRQTATALLQAKLVSDIYLTTSAIAAGEPNTPYYDGPPLPLERVVLKEGQRQERGVRFEHFRVRV